VVEDIFLSENERSGLAVRWVDCSSWGISGWSLRKQISSNAKLLSWLQQKLTLRHSFEYLGLSRISLSWKITHAFSLLSSKEAWVIFVEVTRRNVIVIFPMELVEINESPLFIRVVFLRRILKTHLPNMLTIVTSIKESFEIRVCKRVVVRQRHLIEMIGIDKLFSMGVILLAISLPHG